MSFVEETESRHKTYLPPNFISIRAVRFLRSKHLHIVDKTLALPTWSLSAVPPRAENSLLKSLNVPDVGHCRRDEENNPQCILATLKSLEEGDITTVGY